MAQLGPGPRRRHPVTVGRPLPKLPEGYQKIQFGLGGAGIIVKKILKLGVADPLDVDAAPGLGLTSSLDAAPELSQG